MPCDKHQGMMGIQTQILYGKPVAETLLQTLKGEIASLERPPCVALIRVGNDGASISYVQKKAATAAQLGIRSNVKVFDATVTEAQLLELIAALNADPSVDGILVQAPLPKPLDFTKIVGTILPEKDVDGLGVYNCGRLWQERSALVPCTPAGIIELLKYYRIETTGRHVVIVNRSLIVGKPLCALFLQRSPFGDATVTVCHSHSNDLKALTQTADVLILACGRPHAFDETFVKKGAVVIDVGITRVPANNERGYQLQGDADFDRLMHHAAAITPVPGGVGPMTVALLMKNTVQAYHLCKHRPLS